MDDKTKKLVSTVLILLGVAAIAVIVIAYIEYSNSTSMFKSFSGGPAVLFQIIAGVISIWAGISMKKDLQPEGAVKKQNFGMKSKIGYGVKTKNSDTES